jgi:hypothetical protein
MNGELTKADVYSKNVQKQITAWASIRNDAAHAKYNGYSEGELRPMIACVRVFIGRHPA